MNLKRIAVALAVAGVTTLGLGSAGSAAPAYPPAAATVVVSDTTPPAGGTITVSVNNCRAGETVRFTLPPAVPVTVTCSASGAASASLAVPTASGTYNGTVELVSSGATLPFQITVTAPSGGGLPATGSDGTQTGLWFAGGLLALGAGLLGVAQLRRRQTRLA
jgi:LPXTG-motif cell wall-anchored protein